MRCKRQFGTTDIQPRTEISATVTKPEQSPTESGLVKKAHLATSVTIKDLVQKLEAYHTIKEAAKPAPATRPQSTDNKNVELPTTRKPTRPRNQAAAAQTNPTRCASPKFLDNIASKYGNLEDLLAPRKPSFRVTHRERFTTNGEQRKNALIDLEKTQREQLLRDLAVSSSDEGEIFELSD